MATDTVIACVFCKTILDKIDECNMNLRNTKRGEVNVAKFVKKSVLHLNGWEDLKSVFICLPCLETVNQLEEYFIKSRSIQNALMGQYFGEQYMDIEEKVNLIEIDETVPKSATDNLLEEELTDISNKNKSEPKIVKIKEEPKDSNTESTTRRSLRLSKKKRKVYRLKQSVSSEDEEECEEQRTKPGTETKQSHNKNIKSQNENNESLNKKKPTITYLPTAIAIKRPKKLKPRDRIYTCDICMKKYDVYNSYWSHCQQHKNSKFKCEICDRVFAERRYLEKHQLRHKGIHLHQCEKCGKGFLKSIHLRRHLITHTEVKEHICDDCGKRFREKNNLKRHLIVHEKSLLWLDPLPK